MGEFTMEDAENDGLIKREVGSQLASVLKRDGGQLWRMFVKVCENQGREPKMVLGEGAVQALNDGDFSARIADVEIDMTQLKAGELRKEDLKFVKELRDEFREEESEDLSFIDDLVKERLKAKTESPIPQVGQNGGADEETRREIQQLKSQVDEIAKHVKGGQETVDTSDQKKDLDDIFSGTGDGTDSDSEKEAEEQPEENASEPSGGETSEETQTETTSDVDKDGVDGRTTIEPESHGEEETTETEDSIIGDVEISDHGSSKTEEEGSEVADPEEDNNVMSANGSEIKSSKDAEEAGEKDE